MPRLVCHVRVSPRRSGHLWSFLAGLVEHDLERLRDRIHGRSGRLLPGEHVLQRRAEEPIDLAVLRAVEHRPAALRYGVDQRAAVVPRYAVCGDGQRGLGRRRRQLAPGAGQLVDGVLGEVLERFPGTGWFFPSLGMT